ncbi:hypothetical protein ES705_33168 [subsurface metagenome]
MFDSCDELLRKIQLQQRSQVRLIRFEEQPVPQSSVNDLFEKLWRRFTTRSEEDAEIVLLKRNLLAREENGTLCASVAGVLLCSERPVAETIGDVQRGYYMEKRGDGVPIILRESKELSGKTPVYKLIDDSELLLIIYAA